MLLQVIINFVIEWLLAIEGRSGQDVRERQKAERKERFDIYLHRTVAELCMDTCMEDQSRLATRFLFALRVILLHYRSGRDPMACLATRLASIMVASEAIELVETVLRYWPEQLHVRPVCCSRLSHDERTLACMIDAVAMRDRRAFDAQLEGFVRKERHRPLWDQAVRLVGAEMR